MNFTVGFIALFLMLVLPGMIFRRMYFLGEFSKQLSTAEPIVRTITYAVIPSVVIQIICVFFYDKLVQTIDLGEVIDFYKKLGNPLIYFKDDDSIPVKELIFGNFIWYSFVVYFFSALFGQFSYILVRRLRLDIKFKILRFKNQWAYIFSGEILTFSKFKNNQDSNNNLKHLFPYLDVLVKKSDSETILYNGYLKDYDLNCNNIQELDKIYLTQTTRYKESNSEPKEVPGDFFIIPGKEIKNINVHYIYSENEAEIEKSWKHRLLSLYKAFLVFLIIFSLPMYFIPFKALMDWDLYSIFFAIVWYKKFFIWFVTNSLYSLLFPFVNDSEKESYYKWISWRRYLGHILTIAIYVLIMYFWLF